MKYFVILLMAIAAFSPLSADASLCKNITEATGYIDVDTNSQEAPDVLKQRDQYKQKLVAISKELELTKFEITSESSNIYASDTSVAEGLSNVKYITVGSRINFKFAPHTKIQALFQKLKDAGIDADLTSETNVECDTY